MHLYWRLPILLQETILSGYAWHLERLYYGPGYKKWCQLSKSWLNLPRDVAEGWQNQQLQSLVELAATAVPYYKKEWKDFDWKSVRSTADLHILPLVQCNLRRIFRR